MQYCTYVHSHIRVHVGERNTDTSEMMRLRICLLLYICIGVNIMVEEGHMISTIAYKGILDMVRTYKPQCMALPGLRMLDN